MSRKVMRRLWDHAMIARATAPRWRFQKGAFAGFQRKLLEARGKLTRLRFLKALFTDTRSVAWALKALLVGVLLYSYYTKRISPYVAFRKFKAKVANLQPEKLRLKFADDVTTPEGLAAGQKESFLETPATIPSKGIKMIHLSPHAIRVFPSTPAELKWILKEVKRNGFAHIIVHSSNLDESEARGVYTVQICLYHFQKMYLHPYLNDLVAEPGVTVNQFVAHVHKNWKNAPPVEELSEDAPLNVALCSDERLSRVLGPHLRVASPQPLSGSESRFILRNPHLADYFPRLDYACANHERALLYLQFKEARNLPNQARPASREAQQHP